MKQLLTVYEFELKSYMKNKAFVIMTIIIAVLIGLVTFAPRVIDMSDFTDIDEDEEMIVEEELSIGLVDAGGVFSDDSLLKAAFPDTEFLHMESEDDLKKAVENEEVDAGFYVVDDVTYNYYVLNMDMLDMNQYVFEDVLATMHKMNYCAEHNIDFAEFAVEYEAPIQSEQIVIGKAAEDNFWYCYALVMLVFIVIVMYGTMIATSVTTEKSNRSIEVLVTSVDTKNLLFGKVLAGVTSVIVQVGLIIGIALTGYSVNREYWDGALDMLFDIPAEVLVAFAVFGIGGFTFYACLYAAMGALVSKTEDVNKSAGGVQMTLMIIYFAVMFLLQFPDSIAMKVCSYLPVSSYTAMFVRIGMGKVELWEIIVSAVILYASIVAAGWFAAKIYRMGTLRYGNPIKITTAIKELRKSE